MAEEAPTPPPVPGRPGWFTFVKKAAFSVATPFSIHSNEESRNKRVPQNNLKYLQYGIFTVVYEASRYHDVTLRQGIQTVMDLYDMGSFATRLFAEVFFLAPIPLVLYIFSSLWKGVASALGLYACSVLLNLIETRTANRSGDERDMELIVLAWVLSALISTMVARLFDDTKAILRSQLKAHFFPKLAQASLNLDLATYLDPEVSALFPTDFLFEDEAPGWGVIESICRTMGGLVSLALHAAVLISAFSRQGDYESVSLLALCAAHPILISIFPKDAVGGRPYIYYTENPLYNRLDRLYRIAFGYGYRQDLITDDAQSYILEEFTRATRALGVDKRNDPSPIRLAIPRAWFWNFLEDIALELPFASFALALSMSSLTSMILLLQALHSFRNLTPLSACCASMRDAFAYSKRLYAATETKSPMPHGVLNYPHEPSSSLEGIRISFRNVSFNYPGHFRSYGQGREVLSDLSFDILPGQIVLIVGVNGCGKSTTLKLLSRLFDPTRGQIMIDDNPLQEYDIGAVRASTCVLTQGHEIYPLTVRENLQLGLRGQVSRDALEKAARSGGSYDFIQRFTDQFDSVMGQFEGCHKSPVFSPAIGGCGDGLPASLKQEYAKRTTDLPILSGGEKQRLAASRTFLRLQNSDTRLVIVDEPSSALDAIAEMNLFTRLRELRKGKTMIFVTHRFGHLAKYADLILCMKEGTVIEKGTHRELIRTGGEYAQLYTSQAEGFDDSQ
ncbi:hypothetical protein JAAARDRAFT_191368 [Jaapia argillacea MUCL 33604]|uniref:ABC transporter domain-containing protein n=1 Tax=Jaapia argillacea MUCL 33604 TaxID=933084 RepID=A0A067QCP4_9AGAM|nr:hypothetical protein JAAARDRAFT_191368 [Jaapia argillacea MUCL 33604]